MYEKNQGIIMPHSEGSEFLEVNTHILPIRGKSLCETSVPESNSLSQKVPDRANESKVRKIYCSVVREA